MPRYAAFLRAVNVGGRVVKMDALRKIFSDAGFENVETVIASGNVLFDSAARSAGRIEASIEASLRRALGYEVTTFVRSGAEVLALTRHPLVADEPPEEDVTLYVAFLREPPARAAARALAAVGSDVDEFHVHDRHVFWRLRGPFRESRFSGPALEKILGMPATLRNSTTVRRIGQKFGRP